MNDQFVYKYPVVYRAGQKNVYFNMKVFWRWIIMAIWHGATTYFGSVYVSNTLLLVKLMLTLSCTGIGWPD